MDKNTIKKYAVWARRELIARVSQKALRYEITAEHCSDINLDSVGDTLLSSTEKKQRQALIIQIEEKGYEQVIEEVAYTWFNRFSAMRFMEVNGYLPTHVRVFTDEDNNFKPQIITEAIHLELDGLDMEKVYTLKDKNKTDELYKYLLITQCNALNSILPVMFQKIEDYTELLFPDNLLREGSVIQQMIELIPEEDWKDAVQIIGWLYQYYNSEKKDNVFAALKKNVKITKENIPAATQLFTPDWIVRYMVENSLGRLWIGGHPNDELKASWKYYFDEANQEPEIEEQLTEIRKEYESLKPENIKCIDPCCGSGHILAYLFDILMQIYETYGYTTREAVASIVENNIYGLDIDNRAVQLANFAIMMKARQYDRRFFSHVVQPKVYAIVESNHIDSYTIDYFANGNAELEKAIKTIVEEMYDAKEYGSILNVTPQDWADLYDRFDEIGQEISMYQELVLNNLLPLVQVAQTLARKYNIVVTNPPYMGRRNMSEGLSKFIKNKYLDYKSDLFSVFVIRCTELAKLNGFLGFLTPYVWMFIQSYENMRHKIYTTKNIETLIQFEYSAFEEATVPICTFVIQNKKVDKKGCYLRLTDFRGGMEIQKKKVLEAIADKNCGYYFESNSKDFEKIPCSPVSYWLSDKFLKIFEFPKIGEIANSKQGLATADNNRFLRQWYEVRLNKIKFDATSIEDAVKSEAKWFPYNKGGEFRKWYGNNDYIVNWEHNGIEIRNFKDAKGKLRSRPQNTDFYFRESVSWSLISSSVAAFRYKPHGYIFDVAGMSLFSKDDLLYLLALCNTKIVMNILKVIAPTINYQCGDIANIPVIFDNANKAWIDDITKENILISKSDWDFFEISWDFVRHPLVLSKKDRQDQIEAQFIQEILEKFGLISWHYEQWFNECEKRFNTLKANEEELNRIFIDIYGLQDELTPEVEDKDVTVRKADLERDIKSLISYAVGCMFGRYSLDEAGLAYAGGEWNPDKYHSYPADKDNIIPICDDEYFTDDIVGKFVKFIETVYGKKTLDSNLKFIADTLGGKGQSIDVIRNYFINDFYADHCKIYQKRPIYWLFDSGKKGGFKALIYMHRYQQDTIACMRTDYVHEQQARYRAEISDLETRIASAFTSERVKLNKQLSILQNKATEIRQYEEKIHHLADQMIRIDLDDGVKHNYEIFKDVLAKIK